MAPSQLPAPNYTGTPRRLDVPVGTVLVRVHDRAFAADAFNPTLAPSGPGGHLRGGRFDATAGDAFPFLYAADDVATAFSEALLRDLPADPRGTRILSAAQVADRQVSRLSTQAPLSLVTLRSGRDLAAIGQDTWLTTASRPDYPMTRQWCSALRQWAPWAHGLTWRSNREPDGFAYILFGDRCPPHCLATAPPGTRPLATAQPLDAAAGLHNLDDLLDAYRIVLA